MTDAADLRRLLLAFPELKVEEGFVAAGLRSSEANEEAFAAWRDIVAQEIEPDDEDSGY